MFKLLLSAPVRVITIYGLIFFKILTNLDQLKFWQNLTFLVKKLQHSEHSKNKFNSPIFELKNPNKVSKKDINSFIKIDFGFFYLTKSKTNTVIL